MAQTNRNHTLRCDKDGYFDLDCLKPYSSVWVTTCSRDIRGTRDIVDDENESKKLVTSSRECDNHNSYLDNLEDDTSPNSSDKNLSQKFSIKCDDQSELFYKNSSNFDLQKSEKQSATMHIKNLSEQFLESVCMLDSSNVNESEDSDLVTQHGKQEDEQSIELTNAIPETVKMVKSIEKFNHEDVFLDEKCKPELVEDDKYKQEETLKNNTHKQKVLKNVEDAGDNNIFSNSTSPIPNSCSIYKNQVEHFGDSKNFKLLSDNGKLVSELDITSLKLKDQRGREYPITVKYVWETDSSELMNAAGNILRTSQEFINIIDSVLTIGLKSENFYATTDLNGTEKDQKEITSDLKEFKDKELTFAKSNPIKLYRQEESDKNFSSEMEDDSTRRLFHAKFQPKKQNSSPNQGLKETDKYPVEANKNRIGAAASDGHSVEDRSDSNFKRKNLVSNSNEMKFNPINSSRPSTYNKYFNKKRESENSERNMRPPTAPLRKNSVSIKSGLKTSTKFLKDDSSKTMICTSNKKIGTKFHNTTLNCKNIWK